MRYIRLIHERFRIFKNVFFMCPFWRSQQSRWIANKDTRTMVAEGAYQVSRPIKLPPPFLVIQWTWWHKSFIMLITTATASFLCMFIMLDVKLLTRPQPSPFCFGRVVITIFNIKLFFSTFLIYVCMSSHI